MLGCLVFMGGGGSGPKPCTLNGMVASISCMQGFHHLWGSDGMFEGGGFEYRLGFRV